MAHVVAALGGLIAAVSLLSCISPSGLRKVIGWLRGERLLRIAVGARIVLGIFLIVAAPYCRPEYFTQEIVRVLGALALAAAVLLAMLGTSLVTEITGWIFSWPNKYLRLWLLVGIALGGYLIYASGVW